MRGLQKSKRVSWPSDVNLCQVRLFLSEDSPSQVGQVGLGAQDHLQAKTSWLLHSNGMGSDDNLPPGFEGAHPANQLKNKLSQIPLITWRCPPKFVLNFTWQVVAGEESNEVEVQKQREMRVLEAVYPRPSAIPPNPSVSIDGEDMDNDDQKILLIPIVPVEDEEAALEMSADTVAPINIPMSSQSLLLPPGIPSASSSNAPNIPNPPANENVAAGMVPGVEPDVVAAASAAFTAVMRSNEQGNLIDHDLLIKILSNPKIIERIVTDQVVSSSNPQAVPNQRLPPIALSDQPPGHVSRVETNIPLSAAIPSGPFYSQSNGPGPVPAPRPPPSMVGPSSSSPPVRPVTKDINYYKSLIQQHGGERQEPQDQSQSHSQFANRPNHHVLGMNPETVVTHPKPRDSKPKIMKPCIYFHSSRGCRHGANCSYQHDASLQQRVSSMPEVQNAKRMKMDREITGT
ncbi:hypothetical protein VitviT2T_027843 [Vitis vinifera]|uniref:C3H1-type domain-containing protein n=2 Tax=Vitis vinifera TaxID=29760 RepID=A0ABY9DRV9_VITVI|nr:zinc finger CCCH domain-containing protein 6 [Vitis vinifera]WKA10263.1 hypothetical protein VitviT2T_027843 [Vitis vinifera]|eukprot:XP_002277913.1 PREDICTED: zinc finger CCCH domain-containing protein 6 [Vitis vinifera]